MTMMLHTASVEMPSALVLHMLLPLSEMKIITSDSIYRKKETQHAFKKKEQLKRGLKHVVLLVLLP